MRRRLRRRQRPQQRQHGGASSRSGVRRRNGRSSGGFGGGSGGRNSQKITRDLGKDVKKATEALALTKERKEDAECGAEAEDAAVGRSGGSRMGGGYGALGLPRLSAFYQNESRFSRQHERGNSNFQTNETEERI